MVSSSRIGIIPLYVLKVVAPKLLKNYLYPSAKDVRDKLSPNNSFKADARTARRLTPALGLMTSTADTQAFKEALIAAAHGPFFPDWEFQALFGLERAEVASIAESFSSAMPITGDVALTLNNAMANLLGYPHGQDAVWSQWLSVPPAELQTIFSRCRASGNEA